MFLQRVRVTKYRSIRDSGWFDVEKAKTVLIGPNEAGKTALLEAIQRINPPVGTRGFDPLRDYPRSEFDDINSGKILASYVFFSSRRRHTRLQGDWSSDVCSSD